MASSHSLTGIAPAALARVYQDYLSTFPSGLATAGDKALAARAKEKVNNATKDLLTLALALTDEVGGKTTKSVIAGWLAAGDADDRQRELLERVLDQLDQALPLLERRFGTGDPPKVFLVPDGRLDKEKLAPFVQHLAFALETLQDAFDLFRHGGASVLAEVEERISSIPETLPAVGGRAAGPGEFDDADDFDDPDLAGTGVLALAKELLRDKGARGRAQNGVHPPVSPFVKSLIGMIRSLVSEGSLELAGDGTPETLGERLADAMDQLSRQHNPAEAVVNWFVDQDEVEEVYFDGDELRARLGALG